MEKSKYYSKYKNGIVVPTAICAVMFAILFLYSTMTSPDQDIYLSKSLHTFAEIVFVSFISCMVLFYLSIFRYYFSRLYQEKSPSSFLYQIQLPFRVLKYKILFLISAIAYFIFFAFLSNMFIYFINETTIFTLLPSPKPAEQGNMLHTNHNNNIKMQNQATEGSENAIESKPIVYPDYQLIICCNYIGYMPMLILKLSANFSILLIPLNLLIGITISTLVGLNVALNIFILYRYKYAKISRKNFLGALGISTGLFVGCPTCTGSLFYSIAGFSSLVLFASLNSYQILFVVISIPLLLGSLILMGKMLQKTYTNSCNI
ncbi:hypothetical protein [Candidatus Nitrosocosmicus sp. SS]|uniref:hypothetical protein n=1 Tax=Candidatus Nitrosocosmicus agrestis TaxID=2563600 RepID=UPI00122E5314|nr:hypothetical protein [Candidatus Nitrosocosmicus sp. SS]KAA2280340.1 hypothetical protein F1Z66_11130 [Candidatus Nitrosocosmicus sp. SS]KAF0868016.1 hypothetical protein E5N71_12130 [Candidatus Nitrosocosmicus sp. SS]MDR4491551.1 hypothetical protein [Candidatus Nitrosocosmicus sp.]